MKRRALGALSVVLCLAFAGCISTGDFVGTETHGREADRLPPLEIGKQYEIRVLKTGDIPYFFTKAVLLERSDGWLKMRFDQPPAGGWANVLWLPPESIEWIGLLDEESSPSE